MVDMAVLKAENARRWAAAQPTRNFVAVAKSLVAAKSRYLVIEKYTGVPWFFVAVVHERESAQSWTASLAQGDPWNRKSINVPKDRGPFESWEAAAIDALVYCAPYAAKNKDWSVGSLLTELEMYNGLGYAGRSIPSPYIWSGTDQYVCGKYIRDGVFSSGTVDVQPGCAGLIMAMMKLDNTIVFGTPMVPSPPPPIVIPSKTPEKDPWTAAVVNVITAILSIFKRK